MWMVTTADRMPMVGMGVPGEAPTPMDMAVVLAPPKQHKTDQGDLADV